MEELNNMKALWMELNNKVTILEAENRNLARQVMNDKFKSAREKLINKYNAFIIVEVIMIIYVVFFIWWNPLVLEKYRLATFLYWFIFFLFEISVDSYLKQRVKDIDIYGSSISEISSRAAKNWKLHKLGIVVGFPLAVGACILLALALDANEFTVYGMIVGGLIGGLIGMLQLKNFLRYYRLLQSSEE